MEYYSSKDYFRFSSADLSIDPSHLTKRSVLSDSSKIFDPLGLISCITIVVKIIFQQLWKQSIDWDEPLPPDVQRHFMNWRESLVKLSNLRIPRCYTPIHCQIVDQQLIGFSDASEKAYCGVMYLRSTDTTGQVHVSLVMAKTRVAPIKKVSLPQMMRHFQEILSIPLLNLHAFTDSFIVLYWIYGTS